MGTKKPGYRSSRAVALGADNGTRTRDPNLGKVVLYQLSHVRICKTKRAPERPDVAWRFIVFYSLIITFCIVRKQSEPGVETRCVPGKTNGFS